MSEVKVDNLEHRELWERYWGNPDSENAMASLIEAWIPLVRTVLERFAVRIPPEVQTEDLFQSAILGLYSAIERFNPEREANFRTYASHRINGAILDELRRADHLTRSDRKLLKKVQSMIEKVQDSDGRFPDEAEIGRAMGKTANEIGLLLGRAGPLFSLDYSVVSRDGQEMTLAEIIPKSGGRSPASEAEQNDVLVNLRNAFRRLDMREQRILYLYYFEELTLNEIAELFELSEARICQIHSLAVVKLKAIIEKDRAR